MEPALAITADPSPCQYLPDRIWRLRYEFHPTLDTIAYEKKLNEGWRRFGPVLFRPQCPECHQCQPLRVLVATFRPNESQRRAWKGNVNEITLQIGSPAITPEKIDLFDRFHQHQHQAKGWPLQTDQGLEVFTANPFPTEEWRYRLGERLIGLGYVDVLSEGLSAIYFVWDPEERKRSLGTFNVLSMIASARERRLPFVHLGYYVEGCGSLEYKARFEPNQVRSDSGWSS